MQTEWIAYLKKNWFKVSLAVIFIFVAFKKDLSFQINLNTPVQNEQPAPESPDPVQPAKEEKREETLTENLDQPANTSSSSVIDRFKLPLWKEEKRPRQPDAYEHLHKVGEQKVAAYLQRFAHVALSEQEKYGVPAAVVLGNALLMSWAGSREMTLEGNNHFGLKCTPDWQGEMGHYAGKCYRHYDIAWTSFRDHSLFLTTGEMARHFQSLSVNDYKGWARVLEKAGFSGEKEYAKQLIRVIEDYGLQKLDEQD